MQSHFDTFPADLGDVCLRHGTRSNQEKSTKQNRQQGKCSLFVLSNFCWDVSKEYPRDEMQVKIMSTQFKYAIYNLTFYV
jgi:hypothetical protein